MQVNVTLKRGLSLALSLLPALFWILLTLAFDLPYIAHLSLLAALIHELFHILAFSLLSSRCTLRFSFSGMRLSGSRTLSYLEEMLVALAGPLGNLLLFVLFSLIFGREEYLFIFGIINLFSALLNLLPIESLDGYRIADCLFARAGLRGFGTALSSLSLALLSLLSLGALYLMRTVGTGYWIYFLFSFYLIKSVKKGGGRLFERKNEKKGEIQ